MMFSIALAIKLNICYNLTSKNGGFDLWLLMQRQNYRQKVRL